MDNLLRNKCILGNGANHGCAPIPQEGSWIKASEVKDINGLSHGIGWCAPQQGACKLSINVKKGIITEALIETIGCSGMTHSAAMACEILTGKTILEALNTDLVCDAINTAMREVFLQIVYGRSQTAFSNGGLPVGSCLEDLGKNVESKVGTMYGSISNGPRYLNIAEGYVTKLAIDEDNEVIGYEYINFAKFMNHINDGIGAEDALIRSAGTYGRYMEGVAIMEEENVDISITGNSTNPTRFQHPVAGIYKKSCVEKGKKYFSVASGGGTVKCNIKM